MAMSVDNQQFQAELEKARDDARAICAEKGESSAECAAAWDAVEEMQAEVSHQHQQPKKTSFDQYLEENPDAPEARMYED
ncbi:Calvin cycle protein CP12 [Leptolyngbya sp. PCC 6406]|uniref:Calvin cycle protein CP12 n=1 Tax=Leptolyngbya sp. PCC 6406 TaxID=1173264 RepID=UPI001CED0549|nr:Calvin cycle protein CP12 [Leptolyngbya sp. PCC 6406]